MLKASPLIFTLLTLISCHTMSQEPQKVNYERHDGKQSYYMELVPDAETFAGVLVLMPGFSQRAEDVYRDSDLPQKAMAQNFLVVTISTGFNLTSNDFVTEDITNILTDVQIRHELGQEQFVMGGFSAGGTIALRYSEYCHKTPGDFPVVPAGVFTVDSPIDIIAFFDYMERELQRDYSEVGINEANHISKMLENKYGSLDENREVYEKITPFNASSYEKGNEQYLMRPAVRVYHEIDIDWLIKNRRRSALDANFTLASEMISRLVLAGNERAEFIQSDIEGRRHDGRRHPHSWNIVDGDDCIAWIKNLMN